LNFDQDIALFGVFDGHGGAEVAKYTAAHLPDFLKQIKAYQSNDFESALKEAFVDFDKTLINDPVRQQLKALANSDGESDVDEEDDETNVKDLKEEAKIPIQELLTRYAKERLGRSKERKAKLQAQQSIAEELEKEEQTSESAAGSSTTDSVDDKATASNGTNGEAAVDKEKTEGEGSKANGESSKMDAEDVVAGPSSSSSSAQTPDKEVEEESEEAGSSSSRKRKSVKPAKREVENEVSTTSLLDLLSKDFDSEDDDEESDEEASDSDAEADDDDDDDDDDDEDEDDEENDEEESDEEESEDEDSLMKINLSSHLMKGGEVPGKDSGCTAVMALLHKNELFVANAGDSRCVLSRAGKAVEMSFDHKPESETEYKRIKKAGGFVNVEGRVNGGLNLSRAIGDHSYKENADLDMQEQMITALPDIERIQLNNDDEFMVIACDGIWNSMTSQEVIDFVHKRISSEAKLSDICDQLFHSCLAGNSMGDGTGCDNMTCVIVRFDDKKQVQNGNGSSVSHQDSTISDSNKRSIDEASNGEVEPEEKTAKKVCNRE
jgi:protein phosphatase 1G